MQKPHDTYLSSPARNKNAIRLVLTGLSLLILAGIGTVFAIRFADGNLSDSIILLMGAIFILIALIFIRFDYIETAGTILAASLTIMIAILATVGQGIYDIGTMAFPAILIIASLILKRNTVFYLTLLIILCNAWLIFGDLYHLYQPSFPQQSYPRQFVITSLILVITMIAVYILSNTIRNSLFAVERELQEREKVEHALREAEATYRTLVEETSVIIYRDAPLEEGNTDYISPQIEKLLGYPMSDWHKNPRLWKELTHPEDLPLVLSEIKNYIAHGGRSVIEYRMRTKDGRWLWFQDESVVVKDDNDKPLHVHGVLIDITERKNTEQKLKQREAILNAVAETAQLLLKSREWRNEINLILKLLGEATGASHVYIFENHQGVNGELLSSQKYEWAQPGTKSELQNPNYQNTTLMPIPDIEAWFANLSTGKPFYGSKSQYPEYWEKRFDDPGLKTILDVPIIVNGQWWGIIGFDDYVHEMPWSKAEADALIAAAGNLGASIERQLSEQALRVSEKKFELAFHHTYVAMAISRMADHTLLDVNDAFCNITGYTRAEVLNRRAGRDLQIWAHQNDRNFILDTLETKGYIDEYRAQFRRKNGEIGVGLLSAVHVSIDGEPCQLYTFYDISRIDQLMNELKSKNEELQTFTYTVSHDLKAPLVTISGFMGYLEQDIKNGDPAKVNKDITRITEAAAKMQRLLNELLELSRIGRLMNPPEEVPLQEIVQDALKAVEGQLQRGQVRVEVDADLPSVFGDKVRLVEVIQNLVDNATKFMGDQVQPAIHIGMDNMQGVQTFFVRDNGIGLEAEHFDRIFGLFNKLDVNTEGTGIGLSLVKRIVEVHGGNIWVESAGNGKGSTFYFTLADRPLTSQS